MLDYSKIKKVATQLHPKTGEEWFKKDSFITRYHLGTYDLDNELRVLNRAVMSYMTSNELTEDEKKEARNLLFFINDMTEITNYIRRTQELFEETLETNVDCLHV
jgi:Na+/phosphate symporter